MRGRLLLIRFVLPFYDHQILDILFVGLERILSPSEAVKKCCYGFPQSGIMFLTLRTSLGSCNTPYIGTAPFFNAPCRCLGLFRLVSCTIRLQPPRCPRELVQRFHTRSRWLVNATSIIGVAPPPVHACRLRRSAWRSRYHRFRDPSRSYGVI